MPFNLDFHVRMRPTRQLFGEIFLGFMDAFSSNICYLVDEILILRGQYLVTQMILRGHKIDKYSSSCAQRNRYLGAQEIFISSKY